MARNTWLVIGFSAAALGLSVAAAGGGAPAPPPPFPVQSPPVSVLIPGTAVHHVPSASFNLFIYGGRYYSFHNGAWFSGPSNNGPWALMTTDRVPKPVLGVPLKYYKVPPGQAKKMGGPTGAGSGQGREAKGKKGSEN